MTDQTPAKRGPGRPTTYKPEYAQMLLDYMSNNYVREVEQTHTNRKGESWSTTEEKAEPLRFITQFAREVVGVTIDCLERWAKKYDDFGRAYTHARQIQSEHILQCGFLGLADGNMAKFAAVNLTDLKDGPNQAIGQGNTLILVIDGGDAARSIESRVLDALPINPLQVVVDHEPTEMCLDDPET